MWYESFKLCTISPAGVRKMRIELKLLLFDGATINLRTMEFSTWETEFGASRMLCFPNKFLEHYCFFYSALQWLVCTRRLLHSKENAIFFDNRHPKSSLFSCRKEKDIILLILHFSESFISQEEKSWKFWGRLDLNICSLRKQTFVFSFCEEQYFHP